MKMDLKNINSDSQGSDEPAPPGTSGFVDKNLKPSLVRSPMASPSSPGMLQAKKKLRAFSIQKKAVITPITVPKPVSTGNTTVLIGKLSGVKEKPKPEPPDPDVKKPPKPPKPGTSRKLYQENYTEIQKKNVAEIEDMKRKMELVELGIPLGLICPTSTSEKAMPTKAMPPIKSFLDPAKVDELIREAKKAKAEGKNFKFELSKFLPDYDNPFQRKKENQTEEDSKDHSKDKEKDRDRKDKRKSDKYEYKRHDHRKKDDRDRYKDKSKDRDRKDRHEKEEKKDEPKKVDKNKEKEPNKKSEKDIKETDVNLNDYLVCDSWSLETEDKTNSSSPKTTEKAIKTASIPLPNEDKPNELVEKSKKTAKLDGVPIDVEAQKPVKVEKLKPVIDSFKYELDSNEDEVLDIFDEDTDNLDKYDKPTLKKPTNHYDSPASLKVYDYDQEPTTADDENFLESVINEIKQEDMSDISQDKGLVEYDMSPLRDDEVDVQGPESRESVTPELDDRMRDLTSQQSSYSEGYRSSESGYKSRESGYKSDRSESFTSAEKEMDETLERKLSQSTMDSLETWSFILKICQPLLFRHDKNKCYKETRTTPKLWYTENPRRCSCVKDRAVVYEELETCKLPLVDRVYGCDQIAEESPPTVQLWYPCHTSCFVEPSVPLTNDWESEEPAREDKRDSATPRSEEIYLDREYQRFMEAVWPEVSDSKADTSRSTTPVREARKKKKADPDGEEKKKAKKIKLSSEGWSQESEPEEEPEKSKKTKEKSRKRKLSTALTIESDSGDGRKRKKALKRKLSKKTKSKEAKRRRLSKKYLRKLKEKNKKKKKQAKEKSENESEDEKEKKKEKKAKKKKQLKQKKAVKKKARVKSTSSSSSSSDSSSDTSSDDRKKKKVEKRKKKKEKKRKQSSDSTQSEELFDVNILKNIKTERLTDDEKRIEFSPRRHGEKPREIINVKELQNDFVGNNIHIKQERIDKQEEKEITPEVEVPVASEKPEVVEDSNTSEFKEPEPQQVQQIPIPQTTPQPELVPPPDTPQPELIPPPDTPQLEETSQCSSQESISSKDHYEKDDSHLRPSSQNSNYSFNDVMASHGYQKDEMAYQKGGDVSYQKGDDMARYEKGEMARYQRLDEMARYQKDDTMSHSYQKGDDTMSHSYQKGDDTLSHSYQKGDEEEYEPANYEMYEQMAMAYQSGVASQQSNLSMDFTEDVCFDSHRIETVVGGRPLGEIKCDWRAGDRPPEHHAPRQRPSRWGLKPGQVNIVLTGGNDQYEHSERSDAASRNVMEVARSVTEPARSVMEPARSVMEPARSVTEPVRSEVHNEPVYKIESIANRSVDNTSMSYDEAYMDMYGASDRLQYGDCFSSPPPPAVVPPRPSPPPASRPAPRPAPRPAAGDPRRSTLDARIDLALKNTILGDVAKDEEDKDTPEKGILVSKAPEPRAAKRVSFADGYTPGQDSDVEAPPKKKKKVRRYGCAWPCPAEHPDHVPLWDALPPPPPPASPPPPSPAGLPPALLAALRRPPPGMQGLMSDPMLQQQLAHHQQKFDPNSSLPPFMPPEPPPGMINFLNN